MKTWIGRAAAAALLGFGANRADAQITTVIAPPKRAEAAVQAAARREEVAQDSIARVTLTGMKQWVDSAAQALALRPDTGTSPSEAPAAVAPAAPPRADSTPRQPAVREGVRAPDTATQMPALALVGAAMVLLGLVIRRRSSDVARVRARR